MSRKHLKGWSKHGDFILLDILCLQLCFILSFFLFHGLSNPYAIEDYQYQAVIFTVSQLLVILFGNNYEGIIRRGRFDELVAVVKYILEIDVIILFYLFMIKNSATASRLQVGFTSVFFIIIDFTLRQLNKKRIFYNGTREANRRSIVLITGKDYVTDALDRLNAPGEYHDYFISGILLLDADEPVSFEGVTIPVGPVNEKSLSTLSHGWVDEVFLLQPENIPYPSELMDMLLNMGLTVNFAMSAVNDERWTYLDVRKLGSYKVLTNSVRFAGTGQVAAKRVMDIAGSVIGCIVTAILFIFVAPAIYIKDPGPIFFTQERVGQNGKPFKMHKFRSMYMDAEERREQLARQNKTGDGKLFKIDDDPRIIGSEKKDKNGRSRGIGNFIRRTSIDEFPQFFDVLIGNMSLVGWRPCTLQEWENYDLKHRIRASMKPGMTGMWQVSGRSDITDFDEIVRMDREYMEEWSLLLDVKIILKTIKVVVTRKGAE